MPLTLKVGLGAATCSVGLACAVGIPLSMKSSTLNNQSLSSQVQDGTGKDIDRGGQLEIKKCETQEPSGLQEVDFGDNKVKDVCWTVEGFEEQLNKELGSNNGYTKLFEEKWSQNTSSGSDASQDQDGGKTVCLSSWLMSVEGNGREILGLCERNHLNPNKFIEKMKSSGNQITLKVCVGTCFQEPQRAGSFKKFETTQGDGKEVKFYGREDQS